MVEEYTNLLDVAHYVIERSQSLRLAVAPDVIREMDAAQPVQARHEFQPRLFAGIPVYVDDELRPGTFELRVEPRKAVKP